jgi:hypothetical protein
MIERRIYEVKVRTDFDEYVGTFFSPSPNRRLSEVINRIEGFLSLKEVTCTNSGEKYPFIMINKASVESIRVLEENIEEEGMEEEDS